MTFSEWRDFARAQARMILADLDLCAASPSLAEIANNHLKKSHRAPIMRPPHRPRPTPRVIEGSQA